MRKLRNIAYMAMIAAGGISGLTSCNSDEPGNEIKEAALMKIELKTEQIPYVEASNQFADNIWVKLNENHEMQGKNFVFSPLSLQMSLSLLANGASGETLQEIIDVLLPEFNGTASIETLNDLNRTLIEKLPQTDTNAKYALANAVWLDRNISPLQSFVDRTSKYYGAFFFNFVPGSESAKTAINQWCSDATSGLIQDFLKKAPLSKAILLNALFFQHTWKRRFDPAKTKEENFYCESGVMNKVKMMNDEFHSEVFVGEKNWMIRRPYGNGAFVMELYKPIEGATVAEALAEGAGEVYTRDIRLKMPKFKLTSDIDLRDLLVEMGLENALDKTSDYSALAEVPLIFEEVMQTIRIEVDEDGTKIAAVSGVGGDIAALPSEKIDFYLDHPFGYIIRETSTNAILAMGKICAL